MRNGTISHWINTMPSWKISAQAEHSKEEVKVMIRRKCWLPVMVVFTLVLVAQFPLRVSGYQDAAAAAAPVKVDWLQFAFTPDKTANNTSETTINTSNVSGLQLLFNVALPAGDNPDGAPVLLTDISTASGVRDLIFVQGEHGHISAFDANNGAVIWSKAFGTGGTNNSAPAIDPNRMFIYVNGNDGFAHKLNVGDGSEVMGGGWPERTGGGKAASELTVAVAANGHTYLYAANHGQGHITTIDTTTGSQHVFNASCSQFPDVHNPTSCTSTGARPWARGNPYIASLDKFFFSTGNNNGNAWDGCTMWKESWLALPANGSTHISGGCGLPADSWTGTDVTVTVGHDQDIGSGGLTPLPDGLSSKFPHLGVNPGKDHRIRLLNLDNLSGHAAPGHQGGEVQTLSFSTGSLMRAQSAVWTNPANGQVWVFITGNSGTHGFTVDVDSAGNPSLNNHWNIQNGWTTSAVVANGVLFTSADGGEHTSTATLHQVQAINPTTGAILWTGHIDLFHWESPIVVNGTVYMADGNSGGFAGPGGHLRAWRLNNVGSPDFSLSASPSSRSINPGGSTTYTATVTPVNNFAGAVDVSVSSGLPSGATATSCTVTVPPAGSCVITVSTTSTTPTGTFQLTISATGGGMTHAATVRLIVTPPCVTATNGGGWVNTPFASQAGTFTAQFDVTPSIATIGGHVGISHGAQTAYTGFANIVRFTTTGTIDARNGASYSAATTLHYTAGATYHVRMAINIPTHQYSIFVTPPGGSEVTIGSNFAFRTEQNTVTSLNNYGAFVATTTASTLRVCNFTVQ